MRCRYFSTVAPGMGCDEQKGVPVSIGKIQRHPLAQGLLTPQPPPQVIDRSASFRNCRAETVPAQRTPMTSAVKNIDLIFFMISSFQIRTEHSRMNNDQLFPRLGCDEIACA